MTATGLTNRRPRNVPPFKLSRAGADASGVEATTTPQASQANNGRLNVDPADSALTLELSVAEGQSLRNWLLKPAADGSSTMDDEVLKPVMVKLSHDLDFREGVASVRQELEQAGLATAALSDEQVANLSRKIADAKVQPGAAASAA